MIEATNVEQYFGSQNRLNTANSLFVELAASNLRSTPTTNTTKNSCTKLGYSLKTGTCLVLFFIPKRAFRFHLFFKAL